MRILVVEDEVRLATGLKAGFEAEGFAVDVAHSGTDGLWLGRENSYDAIVLDIMLPGLNGYKVCEALRHHEVWSPVLILTAKDGDWDQIEALDTGADDYLTKPFSFEVLLARVRALIRRGLSARPVVLTAGDLTLDPATRAVRRADHLIDLTAREFAVLHYLLRHKGEVVSKDDILANVWDFDFDGDRNIVEVYVRHLRNKVDRPFNRQAIETIRGAGYRLAEKGG